MKRINALTIAGTDPSGGAGIQADLKAFSALGAYGTSAITALVAQNTRGVQSVYYIDPAFVAAQLDSVFSDVRIDSVKIGMLANADIVQAVAERLRHYRPEFVVLDTVMLAKAAIRCWRRRRWHLFGASCCRWCRSLRRTCRKRRRCWRARRRKMKRRCASRRALLAMGCRAVLMKGGHLSENRTGCLAQKASSALPRRASLPATPTAPVARSRPRWRRCARAMPTGRLQWPPPRTTCNKRCNRRARWKWGTVSGRCIISMPGGESTFATTVV